MQYNLIEDEQDRRFSQECRSNNHFKMPNLEYRNSIFSIMNGLNSLQKSHMNLEILNNEREKLNLNYNIAKNFISNKYFQSNTFQEKHLLSNFLLHIENSVKENSQNIQECKLLQEGIQSRFFQIQKELIEKNQNLTKIYLSNSSDKIFSEFLNLSSDNCYLSLKIKQNLENSYLNDNLFNSFFSQENTKFNSTQNSIQSWITSPSESNNKMVNINSMEASDYNDEVKNSSNGINARKTISDDQDLQQKNNHNLKKSKKINLISNKELLFQKQFELACEIYPKKNIGKLNWEERIKLILKFKLKKFFRNEKRKICKRFEGRSKVASKKLRIKGRFVKDTSKKKSIFHINIPSI